MLFGGKENNFKFPGKPGAGTGRTVVAAKGESSLPRLAGLAMTGERASGWLRSETFFPGRRALWGAAFRHIPFLGHLACGGGHRAYHESGELGALSMFAADVQENADLALIARRASEIALVPAVLAVDAPETTDAFSSLNLPEPELAAEFLGGSDDIIDCPTPAQRMLFGERRRRVPEYWSTERAMSLGVRYGEDSLAEKMAGDRLFYFDHVENILSESMELFAELTGRRYDFTSAFETGGAEVLIVVQGSSVRTAYSVASRMRARKGLRVGVVGVRVLRPFPAKRLAELLSGVRTVLVLERSDEPLAGDPRLTREVRAALERTCRREDAPAVSSAVYGLGENCLEPAALIKAVERAVSKDGLKDPVYLSLSGELPGELPPKLEVVRQSVRDHYPAAKGLGLPGEEETCSGMEKLLSARIYGRRGTDLSAVGESLAEGMAGLMELKLRSQADPKSGIYHLALAEKVPPRPPAGMSVRLGIVLDHSALHGPVPFADILPGGVVVLQTLETEPSRIWGLLPERARAAAVERRLSLFGCKLFGTGKETSEEKAEALMGCWAGVLDAEDGPKVDAASLKTASAQAVFKKARQALSPAGEPPAKLSAEGLGRGAPLPRGLKGLPSGGLPIADAHDFHARTGHRYAAGGRPLNAPNPFLASGVLPAGTAVSRPGVSQTGEHPEFLSENCTGCGVCWLVCPDAAFTVRVNRLDELFESAVSRLEGEGNDIAPLARVVRALQGKVSASLSEKPAKGFGEHLKEAAENFLTESELSGSADGETTRLLGLLCERLGELPIALTENFYAKDGGLLSLAVDPQSCKGCLACVAECPDQALKAVPESPESRAARARALAAVDSLPETGTDFLLDPDGEDQGLPPAALLLDGRAYRAVSGGHDGRPGSAIWSAMHLFVAAAAAVMRRRFERKLRKLGELIERLEKHARLGLAVDVSSEDALEKLLEAAQEGGATLSEISGKLDREQRPIDPRWLSRIAGSLAGLKAWRRRLAAVLAGKSSPVGGLLVGDGLAARYPYEPLAIPSARFDAASGVDAALGVFEGHMRRMVVGIAAERTAMLELDEKYRPKDHDPFFENFSWKDLTPEELRLVPPVLVCGESADFYGPGLANFSAALAGRAPLKFLVLDSPESPPHRALTAMSHPGAFVFQGGFGNPERLLAGISGGLFSTRPAVFHIFCSSAPEHGQPSVAAKRARAALYSRAYPSLCSDPDRGAGPAQRLELGGNPDIDSDWPMRTLRYLDEEGEPAQMRVPTTFADFASKEPCFAGEFTEVPRRLWTDAMTPLADYLGLDADERAETAPFIWAVAASEVLLRLTLSERMVRQTEERLEVWNILRGLKRIDEKKVDEEAVAARVRGEFLDRVTRSLVEIAQEGGQG